MRSFFEEFKKFIMRGNVVDLAVGLVIGAAFTAIVNSLVADIFMPVVGVVTGGVSVENMKLHLYKDAYVHWGKFAQMVINFIIIGFSLFLVVKGMNKLKEKDWANHRRRPSQPRPKNYWRKSAIYYGIGVAALSGTTLIGGGADSVLQ